MKPLALAAAARLSVPQCYALFKATTHQTPTQLVTKLRVDWAERLLLTTDLSVQEVAEQSGFDDPYYFSRVFKRTRGLSPTAARQASKSTETEPRPFTPPTE